MAVRSIDDRLQPFVISSSLTNGYVFLQQSLPNDSNTVPLTLKDKHPSSCFYGYNIGIGFDH